MTSIQGHQLLRQDSVQIGSIELNLDLAGIQVSDFGRLLPFAKDRFGSLTVIRERQLTTHRCPSFRASIAKSRPTFQPKKPGAICEEFALKVDQGLQGDILCQNKHK